jgi:hypothetical protein
LTLKVKQNFHKEPPTGKVVKIDSEDHVLVSLGQSDGVTRGQSLDVYRVSGVIIDPDTGEPLGNDLREIGKLVVFDSRENLCTAKLTEKKESPQVRDVVEPTIKKSAIVVLPLVGRGKTHPYQDEYAEEVAQELIADLVNMDVTVVDRETFLRSVTEELARQHSAETKGQFDRELVRRVGKLLGATAVLGGTLTFENTRYYIQGGRSVREKEYVAHFRLVSVETGEILLMHTATLGDRKSRE